MKALKIISLAILASTSSISMAQVTIKTPDTVDILSVNAQEPEFESGGFFSSGKTTILPDGTNQIVFRFEPYFDVSRDERVSVPSKTIIARFDAKDVNLTLEVPKYLNERQAKKNIDSFTWTLKDENGQEIATQQDKLIKEGMQIGRNYSREAEDYNRKGGVAAIAAAGVVAATPVTLPASTNDFSGAANASTDSTAEEMLMFWYNKADADTKARFKEYVNKQ